MPHLNIHFSYSALVKRTSLSLLCIDQHIAIPGLAILKVDQNLVGVFHRSLLDPRLDLLLSRKLKHILNLVRCANRAATDFDAVAKQGEGVDRWKVATVWSTVKRYQPRTTSPFTRRNSPNLDKGTLCCE